MVRGEIAWDEGMKGKDTVLRVEASERKERALGGEN